jgi:hypothetical protein
MTGSLKRKDQNAWLQRSGSTILMKTPILDKDAWLQRSGSTSLDMTGSLKRKDQNATYKTIENSPSVKGLE